MSNRDSRHVRYGLSRHGATNSLYVLALCAVAIFAVLGLLLFDMGRPSRAKTSKLVLYCAAGMRKPVEAIVAEYEDRYGVEIQLQFSGSNTLLSQITAGETGDLFLAAEDSYIRKGQEQGLVVEDIPVAQIRPVILVAADNPKNITGIEDLFRDDVQTAVGNPDAAAIGMETRQLLEASGHWEQLEQQVTRNGTFNPTVPEVANAVKLGTMDAGIVWNITALNFPDLVAIRTPELDASQATVTIGVLESATDPAAALHFARFLTARDEGLEHFKEAGFEPVPDADVWEETPQLTFFCGSVNRRAVEPLIQAFEDREGIEINTVYNGCGILTGQMRILADEQKGRGFPDTYMACDVYYLDTVREMFQEAVQVSDTDVVLVVQEGNPHDIQNLQDLTQPGLRIAVGQPEQCTIGVLTRQLLEHEGLYDEVMANVVSQTTTSALLVPGVIEKHVDVAFAYRTDTLAEADKLEVIPIPSDAAHAVQPFSIARASDHKYLARRFYRAISQGRESFESAGFHWRLEESPDANHP